MKIQKILTIVGLIILVGAAAGCSGLSSAASASSTESTLVETPQGPVTGTSVPSSGPVLSGNSATLAAIPGQGATLTPLTVDASGNLSVTLADNGGSVLMQVGQRFLLDLGETYTWTFSIDDPAIVSRVPNILTIRGSQGLFVAHTAGTTVLHAAGDPACRQSTPACEMPSIAYQIQITVQ